MENLIVQLNTISATPNSIILVTFGKDYDFDEMNQSLECLKKDFPNFNFVGNIEGFIKNITVIESYNGILEEKDVCPL